VALWIVPWRGLWSHSHDRPAEEKSRMGIFKKLSAYWIDFYVNDHHKRERIGAFQRHHGDNNLTTIGVKHGDIGYHNRLAMIPGNP
jgi:hypothetical protein